MLSERLPSLVDAALAALSSERAPIDLAFEEDSGRTVLALGSRRFVFGRDQLSDVLAWERFADALPAAVERARLEEMHRAANETWSSPWSVFTTETTIAWLAWACAGAGTPQWSGSVRAILDAADEDGDIRLTPPAAKGRTMVASLRARRLGAAIEIGEGFRYRSAEGFLATDAIPLTLAAASAGHHVTELAGMPWLARSDVTVADVSVSDVGTQIRVTEKTRPIAPIPDAALAAAPPGGPANAPWAVTPAERQALDDIDVAAHRCR